MLNILEEVVGWVIGAGCDWGKDKIKAVLEDNALAASQESYETKMYQAVIDALNKISYQKYQGQDRIYEAAEVFVKDWAEKGCLDPAVPRRALELVSVETSLNSCKEFIRILYGEIFQKELKEQFAIHTLGDTHAGVFTLKANSEMISKQVGDVSEKLDLSTKEFKEKLNALQLANKAVAVKFANNKKQEYIDEWNAKLFLHTRENDERYTLREAFIMPDYKLNGIGKPHTDLKYLLKEFIEGQSTNKNTLLILGVPGMGKTSVVSYLANEYSDNQNLIILRFTNFEDQDLAQGLIKAVCKELNCDKKDLEGRTLILEGFDEIRYSGDRDNLIKDFLLDIKGLHSFKLLVTSRGNYINNNIGFKNIIALSHFDLEKIKKFGRKLFNIDLQDKIYENEEVLGIPVILYMALTVGVDIYEESNKSELYEKIFALEGGIFDRFSIKGTDGYMSAAHPLEYKKKDFHSILQLLAFKIFDVNSDSEGISKDVYEKVIESYLSGCNGVKSEALNEEKIKALKDITFDFPIKNLFDNTAGHVEFVHKSIYEYFVAEYIYTEIKQRFQSGNETELAKCLSKLLKGNFLTPEIIEFLFFKFENNTVIIARFDIIKAVFDLMMKDGMTYYLEGKVSQVLFAEDRVFYNLLEITYFWSGEKEFSVYIEDEKYFVALLALVKRVLPDRVKIKLVKFNLKNRDLGRLYLSRANLSEADLCEANLAEANLSEANLSEANLSGANLVEANLVEANLSGANLSGANLSEANLSEANLSEANLSGADLSEANLSFTNLKGANLIGVKLSGNHFIQALFDIDNIKFIEHKLSEEVDHTRVLIPLPNEIKTYEIMSYQQYKEWLQEQKQ